MSSIRRVLQEMDARTGWACSHALSIFNSGAMSRTGVSRSMSPSRYSGRCRSPNVLLIGRRGKCVSASQGVGVAVATPTPPPSHARIAHERNAGARHACRSTPRETGVAEISTVLGTHPRLRSSVRLPLLLARRESAHASPTRPARPATSSWAAATGRDAQLPTNASMRGVAADDVEPFERGSPSQNPLLLRDRDGPHPSRRKPAS